MTAHRRRCHAGSQAHRLMERSDFVRFALSAVQTFRVASFFIGSASATANSVSGILRPRTDMRDSLELSSTSAHSSHDFTHVPTPAHRSEGISMPQQSLSDFVSAMEAAGMLVRVKDEKRVDELPRVMEDHPTTAVLVEKINGCEFSFLANAYSNQDQYA